MMTESSPMDGEPKQETIPNPCCTCFWYIGDMWCQHPKSKGSHSTTDYIEGTKTTLHYRMEASMMRYVAWPLALLFGRCGYSGRFWKPKILDEVVAKTEQEKPQP